MAEEVSGGEVVEPGEDERHGDGEEHADLKIEQPVARDIAGNIERDVPGHRGKPNREGGEQRRKALLSGRCRWVW